MATDIDPVATETAKYNAKQNGVQAHVECLTSVGFILSGLLPHQRTPIIASFRLQGLHLEWSHIRDGWLVLVFEKG